MCSRGSDRRRTSIMAGCARAAAAAALALLAGCIAMQVPEQFLVLKAGVSEFKAMAPDDAKIWVREFDDPLEGKLSYWADVLKNEFVQNRGYTLIGEGGAKDGAGNVGSEMVFEATVGGTAQRYLVALFAIEDWGDNTICTVEFAAPKDIFDKHVEGVRKSIATLEP